MHSFFYNVKYSLFEFIFQIASLFTNLLTAAPFRNLLGSAGGSLAGFFFRKLLADTPSSPSSPSSSLSEEEPEGREVGKTQTISKTSLNEI